MNFPSNILSKSKLKDLLLNVQNKYKNWHCSKEFKQDILPSLIYYTNFIDPSDSFYRRGIISTRIYYFLNNLISEKTCPHCGIRIKYFSTTCKECQKYNTEKIEKIKKTNLEKYGVENPFQASDIKEKIKKTNLEKYGVENPFQAKEIKEKIEKTNIEKYGFKNASKSPEIKEKAKQTNLERYSEEYYVLTDEFKEKYKKTCEERYNCSHYSKTDSFKEKIESTCLEKYGHRNFGHGELAFKKKIETNLEKYGTEYPTQTPEIKEKTKRSNIQKYGVEHPNQTETVKNKIKQTNLKKYGTEWAFQSEIIKEKIKKTNLERYGVEHLSQSEEYFNKQQTYKHKEYIFPSGRIEFVQGYEPEVLDELVKHFEENDIIVNGKEMPAIWYIFEQKRRRYYPDIFIKSKNLIIEVKSSYTYECDYEMNQEKMKACLLDNYNFLFVIPR